MLGMSSEQILALVRQMLPVLGGIAVTFGWLTTGQVETATAAILQIAGPLMIVGSSIWTLLKNTKASIVSTAAVTPGVQSIKLEPTVAGRELEQATPANVNVTPPSTAKPL